MNWIAILAGLLLLGVAAYAVYRAFQSPKFIGRLTSYASRQVWQAVRPTVTKPLDPTELQKVQMEYRKGHGDDYFRQRSGGPPKG